MIKVKNLCAGYGEKEVLHGINLTFEPGKVTVLIGPNGCGKSTLLKTLVRIIECSQGEIFVDDKPIREMKSQELAKKTAYLPQHKNIPDISVLKMVLHGRFAYLNYPRKYGEKDLEIARNALQWADMETYADEMVSHLSGGMQQKVYIAMALAQDAQTILLDEPTTYLDVEHQIRLMELVRRLANQGKAVVMVLHDLSQAFRTADNIIVMNQGKVTEIGSPEVIYQSGIIQDVFHVQMEKVCIDGENWYLVLHTVQ